MCFVAQVKQTLTVSPYHQKSTTNCVPSEMVENVIFTNEVAETGRTKKLFSLDDSVVSVQKGKLKETFESCVKLVVQSVWRT